MKKTVITLALVVILVFCLSSIALAAEEGLSNFTRINDYPDGRFADVPAGVWYAESVKDAFELGLVKGVSDSSFSPAGSVTIAETITLACRIHSIYYTGEADFVQSIPWYQAFVDYAIENGIIRAGEYTNMNAKATREQYAGIMSNALPDDALEAINTVEDDAIPDVKMTNTRAAAIYKLYRSGVLAGSDTKGTFNPKSDIKRSEVAALVTRMADPSLRRSITLKIPERVILGKENYHGHVYTGGASSTRYHYEADCAGKYSHEITWEEVDARHLQPCATCVLK